jgi:cysteine desulfurase
VYNIKYGRMVYPTNMTLKKRVYLDYASSTPTDKQVVWAMSPYWTTQFANVGALHSEGVAVKKVVEEARRNTARLLGTKPEEIVWTSGGTEANNLAIFGVVEALVRGGKKYNEVHAVTTAIEHSSVLDCFRELERRGVSVSYIEPSGEGIVSAENVASVFRENTVIVSVAHVNNELGTVQPIRRIAKEVRAFREARRAVYPVLHADSCQALLYLPVKKEILGADLISLDGQKIHGPKGVGLLYHSSGVPISPILFGGSQERGFRPGTPPTPLIVGFNEAFSIVEKERKKYMPRVQKLRDYFISEVEKYLPQAKLNGSRTERIASTANFAILGHKAEFLLLQLDAKGVACGTRSACLEGTGVEGSYVVRSLGKGEEYATSSMRFTLGRKTTRADIMRAVKVLREVVGE